MLNGNALSVRPELVEGLPVCFFLHAMFWAYRLHCNGGAFYAGHTDALERRMAQHSAGSIIGFTRDHLPVVLIWSETFATREEAVLAERRIKGRSRAKKLALIRDDGTALGHVAKSKKDRASTGSARTE